MQANKDFDALIFDVDGTLWDSTKLVAKAWNRALSAHTKLEPTLSGSMMKAVFGKPMTEIFRKLFPLEVLKALDFEVFKNDASAKTGSCLKQTVIESAGKAVKTDADQDTDISADIKKSPMADEERALLIYERLSDYCYAYQKTAMEEECGEVYPKVSETLKALSKKYPLYIVSNCQCGYIEAFLKSTGLRECFKAWLCFGDTGLPKGETIKKLMEAEGIERAVYIGDIEGDAEAAFSADIPFVHAAYGFGEVSAEHCMAKICRFSELEALFL